MGLLQSGICRAVHRVTDVGKIPVQISKDEADEQQAHSMIPKTERYSETSVNKAKTKSLIRMPSAEKAVKTRDTNACGKERKTNPQMLVANEKWLP